jgi:hypothetical protein
MLLFLFYAPCLMLWGLFVSLAEKDVIERRRTSTSKWIVIKTMTIADDGG